MDVLVVGATGATGRLLVGQLLDRGVTVRAVVRDPSRLPTPVREHPGLTIIQGTILDLSPDELAGHVRGCHAVASCLGHSLSFRGLFGPPHRLVTEAARRLCRAIRSHRPSSPVRIHVAHFLARLATDDELWSRWKGRMPVLYDRDPDA